MPPTNPAVHLRALAALAGSSTDLYAAVEDLLLAAAAAIPTCVGISLGLDRSSRAATVTALLPGCAPERIRTSLRLDLPGERSDPLHVRRGPERAQEAAGGAERFAGALVLYGTKAAAFRPLAPALAELLGMDPDRAILDRPLDLATPARGGDVLARELADVRAVDRAVGVLLDRGLLPAAGRLELDRLAVRSGIDAAAAAHRLLAEVRGAGPRRTSLSG